jgi:hypothetical protein
MRNSNPFFGVNRESLYRTDNTPVQHDALYRADNGQQLSVVSRKFNLITHQEAVQPVENVLNKMQIQGSYKYELDKNGARLFAKITLPEYKFDPAVDMAVKNTADGNPESDTYAPMLIVENAYDRGKSYNLSFGMYRFVCSNGVRIGKMIQKLSIRHFGDKYQLPEIEDFVADNLHKSIQGVKTLYAKTNKLDGKDVLLDLIASDVIAERYKKMLMLELAGIVEPVYQKEDGKHPKIVDFTVSQEFTAYALFNLLTAISTHQTRSAITRANMEASIARFFKL